ncbi:IMPG2 protein, partial [Pterocles burchelli]|nr:IMPG2 protein [Pterocles burchelli]
GPAGGRGSGSHLGRGTDSAWGGPSAAPHPSIPSLGAGGQGDPGASTTQPAVGTDPTPLPAAGEGPGLPVPPTTASALGVTSLRAGGAPDPTMGVLGAPDTEGPPGHGHVPPDQTWRPPARPGQPPAPSSTAAVQSGVSPAPPGPPHISPGSTRITPSPQPAPARSSAAPTSPAPQPPTGTSGGVLGLSPTVGTPPAPLSPGHRPSPTSSGGDPAKSPQTLGGSLGGVGDAKPWTATAQPSVTATAVTVTAVTATVTAATASPALRRDMGTVTLEPSAAVSQGDVVGLTWGPPTHLPTVLPGPPQQPTHRPGMLGDRGGPGSSPAAGDTDLVLLSSSPGGHLDADTPRVTPALTAAGRAPPVFIVEDQPPLRRASLLRVPCELVLDMAFVPTLRDPASPERRRLLLSFNRTVSPLFAPVPGFLRLEVTGIRAGSVVLEYDALFAAEWVPAAGLGAILNATLGSSTARGGLAVGAAPVLRHTALARPLDPCAELFSCRGGFACVPGADGNATCTSLCHHGYCKNHGICTHPPDHGPLCQCPVGSDFWFVGLRCDVRVTQQSLLGVAAGVLLSIVLLGAAIAAVAVRRFKALLLEARADQTRSSYRRFCRLDEVSGQWWPRSWPPSASSLDNPAFSASEELLHLHVLDGSCREHGGITRGHKHHPPPPARPGSRPSFQYDWDTSSSSMNDPMVDSGKASDISVSSWPLEPLPWAPFPLLHPLSRQRPPPARRPRSCCEGMELGTLERSWTA